MFTGLIEEVGCVRWVRATERGTQLQLSAPSIAGGLQEGESVAVNGCCLTVAGVRQEDITFDLLEETIRRTNLGNLSAGSPVNLERAVAAGARLGGHFVQGHVDCTAQLLSFEARGVDHRLEIELPETFARYAAFKGSIALNGISLTIAELLPKNLVVWIIPQTRQRTNLRFVEAGDLLNVEFDLLAKYLERLLPGMLSPETPGALARAKPENDRGDRPQQNSETQA